MKKILKRWGIPLLLLCVMLLSGCGALADSPAVSDVPDASAASSGEAEPAASNMAESVQTADQIYIDAVEMTAEIILDEDEPIPLSASVTTAPLNMQAVASGTQVQTNGNGSIDYSNVQDGYVMVQYGAATSNRLKVLVTGPSSVTYNYNLAAGQWVTLPLSDGNGSYQVGLYENVQDTKYAVVTTASFTVTLNDEYGPFLYSNQYVNYAAAPNTVAKAAELTAGKENALDKVQVVYDYVVKNFTYDKDLATTVQSGYLPVLDTVLSKQTGICFDYAAVMSGMLRSQGVPCKLVVGYAGSAYHAWVSVWTEETGWIEGVVYFDGTTWQRMDPTFASSSNQSASIMQYIGDGANYTEKYLY